MRLFFVLLICLSSFFKNVTATPLKKDLPHLACSLIRGESQRFLTKEETKQLNASATAGTADEDRLFYSLLIVDSFPGLDLNSYAGMLLEDLPVHQPNVYDYEKTKLQDFPAIRYSFTGQLQGETLSYHVRILRHKDVFYQQVGFVVHRDPKNPQTRPKAHLPELEIDKSRTPRLKTATHKPTWAQTWLIENGAYKNAGYRFEIELERLKLHPVNEEELTKLHPHAFAGFTNQEHSRQLLTLAFAPKTSQQEAIQAFMSKMPADPTTPAFRLIGAPNHALLFADIQNNDASKLDYDLAASFQPLKPAETAKLWNQLQSPTYKTLILGQNQSFAQNLYLNFDLGVKLKFPQSTVLDAGWMEPGIDSLYQVFFHNLSSGWHALMDLQTLELEADLSCHQQALQSLTMQASQTSTTLMTNWKRTPLKTAGQDDSASILSHSQDSTCIRVLLGSSQVTHAREFIETVSLQQLHTTTRSNAGFTDHRMRYSLKVGQDSRFEKITTPSIQPFGELVKFKLGDQWHYLLSLNAPLMDEDLALELFLNESGAGQYPEIQSRQDSQHFGLDSQERTIRLLVQGSERQIRQISLKRGTTFFSLFILPAPHADPILSEKLQIQF